MQNAKIPFLFPIFNFSYPSTSHSFAFLTLISVQCQQQPRYREQFFQPVSHRHYTWGISSHFSALSMASLAFFLAFLGFQSSQSGQRPGERENKNQSKRDNSTTPIEIHSDKNFVVIARGWCLRFFEWCMHSLRISVMTSILEHYIHSRDQRGI